MEQIKVLEEKVAILEQELVLKDDRLDEALEVIRDIQKLLKHF